jgi:tetratricopeptide (TPR) repeat protein
MKKLALIALLSLASSIASLAAQQPVSFRNLSSASRALPNGNTEITFIAVLNLNVVPISFNFHWERSDGARTAQKVVKINNTGESAYTLEERWSVGPSVQLNSLWEKLYVNTGVTHLVSEPIQANATMESTAPAAATGAHPAYLHALSDLRLARGLLGGWSNPLIMLQCQEATKEIEDAIGEIRAAAISDGKDIDDHPTIDASLDNRGRFIRALELLNKAYKDIDEKETNKADMALRSKALGHISRAREQLNEARRLAHWL